MNWKELPGDMAIVVRNVDTGQVDSYLLSKDNWRRAWACMRDGRVHMWLPAGIPASGSWMTSGRIWTIRQRKFSS